MKFSHFGTIKLDANLLGIFEGPSLNTVRCLGWGYNDPFIITLDFQTPCEGVFRPPKHT